MKKVLLFSLFLVLGLVVSQMLPAMVGEQYSLVKTISNTFLFICLAFIMINVGREFEIDKTRWKSYTEDYFIAMATAAFPWIFVALYYMFVLLPGDLWGSWDAWKENLLLSRFAAPTSAGILFTMLAAAGLKASWVYKKVQVLAKDTLLGKNYDVAAMRYVPAVPGEKITFKMDTATLKSGSGYEIKVFACEVPYKEYLRDMDAQLTYNLIDKAEKQGKFPGLRVGSLEEINNNAGNWE